jgi:ribosome biogenesis GTPase
MSRRRLSKRQLERIQTLQERRRARADLRAETALSEAESEPQRGIVATRHGATAAVADSSQDIHVCLLRQNLGHVVCGDRVIWQKTGGSSGVVTAVSERTTVLARPDYAGRDKPLAANLTQLVVVVAVEPAPSGYLVDQYLAAAETLGIRAAIAVNKVDLLQSPADPRLDRLAGYETIGYPVIRVTARKAHGLDALVTRLRNETSILVGQSGVGKSSLVKALLPDQDIQTGRLSSATGLGRHTTSAATLYFLPSGGTLIDSPGVRSFRLPAMDRQQLERGFREFRPFLGHCQFSNCAHRDEPGCALRAAVTEGRVAQWRLDNFLNMARQLDHQSARGNP